MDVRSRSRKALAIISSWTSLALILACGWMNQEQTEAAGGGMTLSLSPGFDGDPRTDTGTAGGTISASTRSAQCRGSIAPTSNYTLDLAQPFANLRIVVSSPEDTTLVVQMADGSFRCDDDGGGGRNPLIQGAFPAGQHRVWVGSYDESQRPSYTIGFTENPAVNATNLATGGPPAAPTAAAGPAVAIGTGFTPDPTVAAGTAGGAVSATSHNQSCAGWIGAAPNHVLNLQTAFPNLRVVVNGQGADTTLVIRDPAGNYRCDDDGGNNFNPLVAGAFAPGPHQVFVGAYNEGERVSYKIGFTTRPEINGSSPELQ
ncbi:MAG: hypothetical protein ACFCGT_07300 [Sandaracinaceae bacterium]